MYYSEMDLINAKISAMGAISEGKVIDYIVQEDIASAAKNAMYEGVRYYNSDHDSLRKSYNVSDISETEEGEDGYEKETVRRFENPNRSNHHNVHAFHKVLVDQKVSYLVGREPTISVMGAESDENLKAYEDMVCSAADEAFDEMLQDLVRGASNKGYEVLHFYYDETGELKYCIVPAEETVLIYDSQYQKKLEQVIRYYTMSEIRDGVTYQRRRVEWWTAENVTYYKEKEEHVYVRDRDRAVNPAAHWFDIRLTDGMEKKRTPHSWGKVPFIVLENNSGRTTDLKPIKGLIDAYDYISSEGTNNFLDLVDLYWIINGYGGETAGAIVKKLKINKAVSVSGGEGEGIKAQQVNLPVTERLEFLKMLRHDIYHLGMGIDIDDDRFGNTPSGVALKFRYANLRHKADSVATKLKKAIKEFYWFITDDYNRKNGTAYDSALIKITLNYSQISNDLETVQILTSSEGILSKKTQIENHPLVTDVNDELERLEEEEKSREDKYNDLNMTKPQDGDGIIEE